MYDKTLKLAMPLLTVEKKEAPGETVNIFVTRSNEWNIFFSASAWSALGLGGYAGTRRRENDCDGVKSVPAVKVPLTSAVIVRVTADAGIARPPAKIVVVTSLLQFTGLGRRSNFMLRLKIAIVAGVTTTPTPVVSTLIDELL